MVDVVKAFSDIVAESEPMRFWLCFFKAERFPPRCQLERAELHSADNAPKNTPLQAILSTLSLTATTIKLLLQLNLYWLRFLSPWHLTMATGSLWLVRSGAIARCKVDACKERDREVGVRGASQAKLIRKMTNYNGFPCFISASFDANLQCAKWEQVNPGFPFPGTHPPFRFHCTSSAELFLMEHNACVCACGEVWRKVC